MPIDYSKWKAIEVSDDEDDTHPNIDTASLFRWRHQARMERMEAQKQEKESVEQGKKKVSSRLKEIEEKLEKANLEEKERISLELEREEIKKQEEEYRKKEQELEEKERLQPWNVDTIGHEAWSKTIINKPKEKVSEPSKKESEEEASQKLSKYVEENEELLDKFGALDDFEQAEEYLLEHPHLASESATSYLAIEALNNAIVEDFEKMRKIACNYTLLELLLNSAKTYKALPTNKDVIRMFFKNIRRENPELLKMYESEVDSFCERVTKRAVTKRQEFEAEEKAERVKKSPGGLDHEEVFHSLPDEMKEAFLSQSVERLQEVAQTMDSEVFAYHFKRCIDSGLWVPDANAKEGDEAEDEPKGASEEKKE